jgi:DsbC/DsbD-like thiol-disulfide interchange protein
MAAANKTANVAVASCKDICLPQSGHAHRGEQQANDMHCG